MGTIQEFESTNEELKEEIEKTYRHIKSLDRILNIYLDGSDFTRMKLREKSFLEKILPSK
jgi:hypothetical protein